MQCIGIEADVFYPAAVNAAGNLVVTPEVALEHQPAAAHDQNGMHIGRAREAISHPAQRIAVDQPVLVGGGDGPTVVARDRDTAAAGQVGAHRRPGERRQRGATEKGQERASFHAVLPFTRPSPLSKLGPDAKHAQVRSRDRPFVIPGRAFETKLTRSVNLVGRREL